MTEDGWNEATRALSNKLNSTDSRVRLIAHEMALALNILAPFAAYMLLRDDGYSKTSAIVGAAIAFFFASAQRYFLDYQAKPRRYSVKDGEIITTVEED